MNLHHFGENYLVPGVMKVTTVTNSLRELRSRRASPERNRIKLNTKRKPVRISRAY